MALLRADRFPSSIGAFVLAEERFTMLALVVVGGTAHRLSIVFWVILILFGVFGGLAAIGIVASGAANLFSGLFAQDRAWRALVGAVGLIIFTIAFVAAARTGMVIGGITIAAMVVLDIFVRDG